MWFSGLSAYGSGGAWTLTLLGMLYILALMTAAAAGLERKQDERYGDRPDYQEYVRSVPILFPWVPLFTLRKLLIRFR